VDKTAFNAQLVTINSNETRILSSQICWLRKIGCGFRFFANEKMSSLILLLVRLVFSRYDLLVVFRHVQVGRYKVWSGVVGWNGLRGGAVWRVQGGSRQDFSNLCGCRAGLNFAGAEKKFNPSRTLTRNTAAPKNINSWPVMLKLCQPCKHLSCCEYFPAKIQLNSADIFIIIVP